MERTYEPVADSDAEVVGLIAYSILAAMTRLAKDSDQAPTFEAKVEHARMATRVFETFTQVETWCTHRGMDLSTYARAYDGLYDDLDARTRPKTWHERSIKTYVTLGVLGGFLREIASRKNLFPGANWDLEQGEWVRENLAPIFEADEQLAARLSLWARRVAGEVLGLVRSTMFMHPDLSLSPEDSDTIAEVLSSEHAERMRIALINHNSDMVKENSDYCVRITGSDVYGKAKLDYFISVSSLYPVIATTSELLSTGADCKMTRLIVLDKTIESMTTFKQIIGRGTRIREKDGKTHFVVMDFRNVTRLFADPDWDGPIEIVDGYTPNPVGGESGSRGKERPTDPIDVAIKPIVDKNGCSVEVTHKTVSIYDPTGKLLQIESVVDYTKENILGQYATLDLFIEEWRNDPKKDKIKKLLLQHGIDIEAIKKEQNMGDVDDFDFICYIAFNQKPLTRKERADGVKKQDFFNKYNGPAREVLEVLLDKYKNQGITEIVNMGVLRLDPFIKLGKPPKIVSYFGGKEGYISAVADLQNAIYNYGAI